MQKRNVQMDRGCHMIQRLPQQPVPVVRFSKVHQKPPCVTISWDKEGGRDHKHVSMLLTPIKMIY